MTSTRLVRPVFFILDTGHGLPILRKTPVLINFFSNDVICHYQGTNASLLALSIDDVVML